MAKEREDDGECSDTWVRRQQLTPPKSAEWRPAIGRQTGGDSGWGAGKIGAEAQVGGHTDLPESWSPRLGWAPGFGSILDLQFLTCDMGVVRPAKTLSEAKASRAPWSPLLTWASSLVFLVIPVLRRISHPSYLTKFLQFSTLKQACSPPRPPTVGVEFSLSPLSPGS